MGPSLALLALLAGAPCRDVEVAGKTSEQLISEAKAARRAKEPGIAVDLMDACLALQPAPAECHLLLGSALMDGEDVDSAMWHYLEFARLAPRDPRAAQAKAAVDQSTRNGYLKRPSSRPERQLAFGGCMAADQVAAVFEPLRPSVVNCRSDKSPRAKMKIRMFFTVPPEGGLASGGPGDDLNATQLPVAECLTRLTTNLVFPPTHHGPAKVGFAVSFPAGTMTLLGVDEQPSGPDLAEIEEARRREK